MILRTLIIIFCFTLLSCYYPPTFRVINQKTATEKTTPKRNFCSKGWKITGYFTPLEKDYISFKRTIRVKKTGLRSFSSTFLKAVKMEGWGKTNQGWYLGYYGGGWHKSKNPLDAYGKKLVIGVIATDKKLLPKGRRIKIPTLPRYLKNITFTAKDTGGGIRGMHIDLYTGEGRSAEKITFLVTGKKHTICLVK